MLTPYPLRKIFKTKVCGGDFHATLKSTDLSFSLPADIKLTIQVEGILQRAE